MSEQDPTLLASSPDRKLEKAWTDSMLTIIAHSALDGTERLGPETLRLLEERRAQEHLRDEQTA